MLGVYVTGLTDGDLFRLDMFEGGEYTRQKVEVQIMKKGAKDGDGAEERVETETYIYTEGDEYLEKKEWDYEEFRRDKMQNWTGESDEYAGEETLIRNCCDGQLIVNRGRRGRSWHAQLIR